MKILKYLLFLVLGLVLAFLAAGFLKPSINYGHTITVNKPLQEAWAVHQDASKFNQWLKGFKSIDLISGNQDEIGSTYKVVVNPGEGQSDFEMIETLLARKEFDHVKMHFDSEIMTFEQTTSFAEKDGKTTISTDSKGSGKGMLMRSTFALMELFTGTFKAQEVENIENLKKVIEQNTTDYYPATPVMKPDSLITQ